VSRGVWVRGKKKKKREKEIDGIRTRKSSTRSRHYRKNDGGKINREIEENQNKELNRVNERGSETVRKAEKE